MNTSLTIQVYFSDFHFIFTIDTNTFDPLYFMIVIVTQKGNYNKCII